MTVSRSFTNLDWRSGLLVKIQISDSHQLNLADLDFGLVRGV